MDYQKLIIDAVGWVGSIEVIIAYFLVSYHKVSGHSVTYQWLNVTGALFLIVNTWYYHAYPSMVVNIVWVAIALLALITGKKLAQKKP